METLYQHTQGLKIIWNVKSNAPGLFIFLVSAHITSRVPIQGTWRKEGDTEESSYRWIVRKPLSQASGKENCPKIQNATFKQVRPRVLGLHLFKCILPSGGHPHDTLKRNEWSPFNYECPDSKMPDKPKNLIAQPKGS
jgi:hypothetical protein